MKTIALVIGILPAASALAGLEQERALLQADPVKAAALLQEQLAKRPTDPWLQYNAGVAAYAAKDFAKADELWQQLATTQLPEMLREQVWLQIGNVSYRLVQGQIEKSPDEAVPRLEQSREAFRVSLATNKKNKIAQQNLALVEKELEKIYARLAKRLAEEGKRENWAPKAIEKLQAALTYAQQAETLSKKDPERQAERKDIEKALGEKYDQRAAQEEKTADQRERNSDWARKDAQEHYENALADFQQAQSLDQQDQTAKDGEKRVKDKLADLFDKAGREEQREAEQVAKYSPPDAIEKFEQALDNFENALAVQPEHADAKAGEKEVKEQLEKLHLEQGDRQAQRGEQQLQNNPEAAAQNLTNALENFQAAQALDPQNAEIQPRIDKVEALLPDLLAKLGEQELQQGEKAEQQNDPGEAVENYQQAEANFAQAEALQPGNEKAQQGQQKAQAALARLQQQMAQAQQGQKPGQPQPSKDPQEAKEAFQSMLAKFKENQKDRDVQARHHLGQKYNEERNKNLRNW
jgi:tetratricopeptide (TPR) repeat protein